MTTVCMFKNGMWPALNYLLAWLPEKILIWGAANFNELVNKVEWLDIRAI